MSPRIAIPLPTSTDLEYNRTNWAAFASAIRDAGGEPVEIKLESDDRLIAALAATCHGVLLPGSPADIDPAGYGHPREPATAKPDPSRERIDRLLLEHAQAASLPVLGVCFGAQMLNVFAGGTLIQDLQILPVNHAASASVAAAHPIEVATGSVLEMIMGSEQGMTGGSPRPQVNSSHHQAVGIAGQGLTVSARSPLDGVIEAVEQPGSRFVLGVQWHPERTVGSSATSRQLFSRIVKEAAAVASLRKGRA